MRNEHIIIAYRDRRRVEQARAAQAQYELLQKSLDLTAIMSEVHKGVALHSSGNSITRLDDVERSATIYALVGERKGSYRVSLRIGRKTTETDFNDRASAESFARDQVAG